MVHITVPSFKDSDTVLHKSSVQTTDVSR